MKLRNEAKPKGRKPQETGRKVRLLLKLGRFDQTHDLTHRKAA
jgi:hypothetical protein